MLPIYLYGNPVLRKTAEEITLDYPDLSSLIDEMFDSMKKAEGVGLAAPQIGLSIRLFIIDTAPFQELYPNEEAIQEVFIKHLEQERDNYQQRFHIDIAFVDGSEMRESFDSIEKRDLRLNELLKSM